MLNQLVLIGRLTQDPEIKVLDDGRKVSHITLAVQRAFKNMDGNYDTDFIKITVWEGLASAIESYCTKGTLIAVKARLQTYKMEIEAEKTINMLEVIAERITFLSSPNRTNEAMNEKKFN